MYSYDINNLKEIPIKNRTCYYFDDMLKLKILISKILWFIKFHTKLGLMQNHCVLDLISIYDGTRYSVSFGGEKYDFIYNRSKCGIAYFFPRN